MKDELKKATAWLIRRDNIAAELAEAYLEIIDRHGLNLKEAHEVGLVASALLREILESRPSTPSSTPSGPQRRPSGGATK